jgi:CBS domain containing-hemolysin-like protein
MALVVLNGFFVASEFAIVKVRATRMQELARKGVRRASTATSAIARMDEYLSATQLGITLASLALGWIGEPAFARLFEPLLAGWGRLQSVVTHSLAATMAFLTITFLHIVIGELAPKSLAIQRTEATALWTAWPMLLFYRATYPVIWALNGGANLLLRLFGLSPATDHERGHSEEEIRLILTQSQEKGILGRDQSRMLERVFEFAGRRVRQVMVPSVEVVFLDLHKSVEENLEIARRHKHTRYPLCDGTLERVVGIVHVKDLFWKHRELGSRLDLRLIKRSVQFVPESASVQVALSHLKSSQNHLAVVIDEYGSVVGVVTLDNVLQELVGDIRDEFDWGAEDLAPSIRRVDERRLVVHGRVLLDDLAGELGITIDDDENDTIGGHVMSLLGRSAEVGDEVLVADVFRVRVAGMKGLQIVELVFERVAPAD